MKAKSSIRSFFILTFFSFCIILFSCKTGQVDKTFTKVFEGRLEQSPDICMIVNSIDRKLTGSYFYTDNPENVTVSGQLNRSDSILINEFDGAGNLFGVFKGKFVNPSRIEGVWSKPDGSRPTPFFLTQTNFTYEGLLSEAKSRFETKAAEEVQKGNLEKIEKDKKAMAERITDFLVVTKSKNAKKSKGISDLKVSVVNNSLYSFDRVAIKVNYLSKKGDVESTAVAEFSNVEPGVSQTKTMPDNKRGVTVSCSISRAESSKIQFSYPAK